jgi:hypothetical protein
MVEPSWVDAQWSPSPVTRGAVIADVNTVRDDDDLAVVFASYSVVSWCLAWLGLAWLGLAWLGLAWLGNGWNCTLLAGTM